MSQSIVVLSDLHANATALRAALVEVRALAPDRIIVLGDLLTYGVDIDETLTIVAELAANGAPVLLGNHDKLYLDLAANDRAYFDKLPDWLRESAEQTLRALDDRWFARPFAFVDEYVIGDWLFSHANPFGVPDWTYLNHPPEITRAAEVLRARGMRGGVFGHTHRRRAYRYADGALDRLDETFARAASDDGTFVINPGSVGQPRGDDGRPSFLHLVLDSGSVRGRLVPFDFDTSAHIGRIEATTLSETTKTALTRYFSAT